MVYSWKVYQYKVPAKVVGEEFEKIEKEYGKVTSDVILQKAEVEESPLHELFEWDDAVAGHKYRLSQATNIIINLACEVEEQPKAKPVRAYYNVSTDEKKGKFINMKTAFANPDTKDIILQRAKKELDAFVEKYENLTELSEVITPIREFLNKDEKN